MCSSDLLHPYSGTPILMGDNSAVAATGKGRVQFEDGSFENVLHIPRLSVNLISVYQMTHTQRKESGIYPGFPEHL